MSGSSRQRYFETGAMKSIARQQALFLLHCVLAGACGLLLVSMVVSAQPPATKNFTLGFSLDLFEGADARDATAAIEIYAKEISSLGGNKYTINAVVFENTSGLVNAVRRGSVQLVVLPTLDFFNAKTLCALEPAAIATGREAYGDEYVLLVHQASAAATLPDLKGKSICVLSNARGEIMRRWLEAEWLRAKLPPASEKLYKLKEVAKESQAVMAVFFRQSDACTVTRSCLQTMTEMNPQLKRDLKIVRTSPRLLYSIFCVVEGMDAADRAGLMETITGMNGSSAGRHILTMFQLHRVVLYQPEFIRTMAELVKEPRLPVPQNRRR
jgi:ABC-type phosphate/phosphonate transport system substrate-binding protein